MGLFGVSEEYDEDRTWEFTIDLFIYRALPDRWAELHKVVKAGRKAILEATGTNYRIGNTSRVIKNTVGGSSADYAFGVLEIPFVIVMELPPGGKGFDPPCQEIKRIVKESWIGIREMISCI